MTDTDPLLFAQEQSRPRRKPFQVSLFHSSLTADTLSEEPASAENRVFLACHLAAPQPRRCCNASLQTARQFFRSSQAPRGPTVPSWTTRTILRTLHERVEPLPRTRDVSFCRVSKGMSGHGIHHPRESRDMPKQPSQNAACLLETKSPTTRLVDPGKPRPPPRYRRLARPRLGFNSAVSSPHEPPDASALVAR